MKKPASTQAEDPRDARIAELTNDLQRTRADFENYRKQMDSQKASAVSLAKLDTIRTLLPLLDDLNRAIASTPSLKPLEKSLEKSLKDLGLEKAAAPPGTDFDPNLHEAVLMTEGSGDKEVIDEVLRPGYRYAGDLLRPAMVKVTTA